MRSGHMKSILLVAASVAIAALGAGSAQAAAKDGQQFGDWVARCDATGKYCRIVQVQVAEGGGGRLFEIAIGKIGPKGELGIVTVVPLGVRIQPGVAFQADGKQTNMPIVQCLTNGCQAGIPLDDAGLKALEKTKNFMLGMQDASGKNVTMAVSTKGLSDALLAIK
jgi:invasion protein IalB